MPLQLERCRQSVDAFVQDFQNAVVAAIDHDFADPERARRLNLHSRVGRGDPGPAHPSKTFPHTFKKLWAIVVPLIVIIVANEIGHSLPISAVDRAKEMFRVQPDLMLRPPKPEQIQPDAQCNGQDPDDCSTKRNRHAHHFISSSKVTPFRPRNRRCAALIRRRNSSDSPFDLATHGGKSFKSVATRNACPTTADGGTVGSNAS